MLNLRDDDKIYVISIFRFSYIFFPMEIEENKNVEFFKIRPPGSWK
jgi:hypothetical protein